MNQMSDDFQKMDTLSQKGIPFFFMVDFKKENTEIYTKNELENSRLLIDFKHFKNTNIKLDLPKDYHFKSFPEPKENYAKGFANVKAHLQLGNSYLVNFTRKTKVETSLSLEEIFYLSQAKYKILIPGKFVCFSPETFIEIKNNRILTHPMKGTIDASIENAAEQLKNDHKEKAEHYTVVDLLRNDLSRVANNVQLDEFQRIEFIKTQQKNLLAMSSEISGILKPKFQGKIGSIVNELLPAGSILGAPKAKTMEIIQESEGYDRGFYTGICGWFDGKNLDSGVMIRFIEMENDILYFKSGGGITHKSKLNDEYQEMKNKIYVPFY